MGIINYAVVFLGWFVNKVIIHSANHCLGIVVKLFGKFSNSFKGGCDCLLFRAKYKELFIISIKLGAILGALYI